MEPQPGIACPAHGQDVAVSGNFHRAARRGPCPASYIQTSLSSSPCLAHTPPSWTQLLDEAQMGAAPGRWSWRVSGAGISWCQSQQGVYRALKIKHAASQVGREQLRAPASWAGATFSDVNAVQTNGCQVIPKNEEPPTCMNCQSRGTAVPWATNP